MLFDRPYTIGRTHYGSVDLVTLVWPHSRWEWQAIILSSPVVTIVFYHAIEESCYHSFGWLNRNYAYALLLWGVLLVSTLSTSRYSGYGACVGGPKYYAVNLILRLFLYHFLHTMSLWRHESIHNNTNNQQTPPPWWWSRSPLERHGFNESTLFEWWAALLMFVPRPLSNWQNQ